MIVYVPDLSQVQAQVLDRPSGYHGHPGHCLARRPRQGDQHLQHASKGEHCKDSSWIRLANRHLMTTQLIQEWYGWHFPEMGKIIADNLAYAKCVKAMGFRTNASSTDFGLILPEELENTLKAAAEISMGTEISDSDIDHIHSLCDQVISITEYRKELSQYLTNRMEAMAPNLTAIVGELVGARLISHAGSLNNLAKFPASTIQILGAEKALFRALKTKHDTPKYGLIYHASLIGGAPQKLKGKMARMVATKTALSIRVDALADAETKSNPAAARIGSDNRDKLASRLRALERALGLPPTYIRADRREQAKYDLGADNTASYNNASDEQLIGTQPAGAVDPQEAAMEIVKEVKEEKSADKKDKKKKRFVWRGLMLQRP
jgi:nucleolar protein 58